MTHPAPSRPRRPATRRLCTALLLLALNAAPARASDVPSFPLDSGHAPIDLVIPSVVAATLKQVAPGDAPLILRITTLVTNAWFDAIAPYHPTAVGVHSRLPRRPAAERTDRSRNIAILYATLRVMNSLNPQDTETWRQMLRSAGLDPDDTGTDTATPVGIGNVAGAAIVQARLRDGMNQLGDEGPRGAFAQPYADTTGYRPVNSAYELRDPSRWQPDLVTAGHGVFQIQQPITPQWGRTQPYTGPLPADAKAPPPWASQWPRRAPAYRAQAAEVLARSAALNDERKMTAELFQHKFRSLGRAAGFIAASRRLTLEEFVHYDFLVDVAAFDGGIAVWKQKFRHDAVRPFSAIRFLYGERPVTAWGGAGRGTVHDLPGRAWASYLPTGDHPEYPSGSACFCAAYAQAARRYLGTDDLGWEVPVARGSSEIEPGVTPAADLTLRFDTWTDFERTCGDSRVDAGVHFRAAVEEGARLCRPFGDRAYEFVDAHIRGTASQTP